MVMDIISDRVERPQNLNTAATLMIVNGCLHLLGSIGGAIAILVLGTVLGLFTFGIGLVICLCAILPLAYMAWGTFEIITAGRILKGSGLKSSPIWIGIVDIVLGTLEITTFHGIIILIIGIVNTILLSDSKVKDYFSRTP